MINWCQLKLCVSFSVSPTVSADRTWTLCGCERVCGERGENGHWTTCRPSAEQDKSKSTPRRKSIHASCCIYLGYMPNAFAFATIPQNTVKCHYNACHYNANASLTRSILGSQTAPTCPHNHPQVAQHMGKRCEIIAVWSATAAMTPLCSHTNGIKQRYPTSWLCQYSRFMIDLRSNTLIIHLRCSENAIIRPIWLLDARMLKTIPVAIKLT